MYGQLRFGANMGFVHAFCVTCKEERLHRKEICVSCGTSCRAVGRYKRGDWAEFQVNAGSRKRQREFKQRKQIERKQAG